MKTDRRLVEALDDLLARSFAEDGEDITTLAVFGPRARVAGDMVCREAAVVAGAAFLPRVFAFLHPPASVEVLVEDGARVAAGTVLARVEGPAVTVLAAERTALNLVQRLTGVATATRRAADALASAGGRTRLLDTRKTTPGWRRLEKEAVRAGGGVNHRFSLGDGVLIKDNHVAACGGVGEAVRRARARGNAMLRVEVEVVDLPGLEEAIGAGADIVLLDNMDEAAMAEAVRRARGRVLLEASGNMTLERLPRVAATGVDFVSMGAITHSACAADISFEVEPDR